MSDTIFGSGLTAKRGAAPSQSRETADKPISIATAKTKKLIFVNYRV
jgi:hypothetical protein